MDSSATPTFPKAFSCYKANTEKVYGSICISPFNTILLVRGRKSKKWSFPKGHKHRRETYIDCAVRETYEEAGVDLEGVLPIAYQRLSVGEYYFYDLDSEATPSIRDTNEITEARWMSVDDMRGEPCNVDVNNFLSRLRRNSAFFREI
jgi:8-oxo-dGTP pyrophosphatase MutT (NUDIX family)